MPAITTIKFRRGTAAQWASTNPVLAAGEMGLESDTRKFKFGNGTLQWNSIAYASAVGTKGEGFLISETEPVGPDIGDVWYCSATTGDLAGKSFIRYDGYWVEINPGTLGPKGDTGTIEVGTVTTGAPGSSAVITNVGTNSSATLNFTIPRGETGETGATGATGTAATVAAGTTTTGDAGTSASVTNSGTSSAAVFDFTIPRGDTGATGATGAPGAAATIAVGTTTTGAAGSSASVVNSGTSSAAVFDFTVPAGATGPQGETGATGETGAQGPSGVVAVTSPITNSGTSTSATIGIDQTLLAINMKQVATTVSDKAAGYTILATDKNTFIRSTSATAVTMTIDNVLAVGESIQFIQFGAGQITFAAGAGATLRSVDDKLKSNKQYSVVAITCVASGEYLVTGDVVA